MKRRPLASGARTPSAARGAARERNVNAAPTRIGAVADIGSNSIHLLVAVTDGRRLGSLTDESIPSELGRLVERREEIGGRATSGVIEALERFHSRALRLGAGSLTVVATEPLRRAKDRSNVVKEIRGRLGLEPIVLEHEEEGLLTVLGLIHPHDRSTPIIVGDIGGGSTEIVRLTPGRSPVAQGFSIGSARLMARVNYADPPKLREWRALRVHAQTALSALGGLIAERAHELDFHLAPGCATRTDLVRGEVCDKPTLSLNGPAPSALLHLCNLVQIRCELRADLSDDLDGDLFALEFKLFAHKVCTVSVRVSFQGVARWCPRRLSPPQRPASGDERSGVVEIGVEDLHRSLRRAKAPGGGESGRLSRTGEILQLSLFSHDLRSRHR